LLDSEIENKSLQLSQQSLFCAASSYLKIVKPKLAGSAPSELASVSLEKTFEIIKSYKDKKIHFNTHGYMVRKPMW